MTSASERLHNYCLFYHQLRATQYRATPGEPQTLETRLRQAELKCLEELIFIFANVSPTTTNETHNTQLEPKRDSLDVSLVANILLLSPPSPWIVYVVDTSTPESRLCYVSPSVKRLLGWRPTDMVGKPIFEGCHPHDVQVLQHIFQPKAFSSWRGVQSHTFGEYVSLRRIRRDQHVAFLHGTGITIGPTWYAWVEQDSIELKLAHNGSTVGTSVSLVDGKSCNTQETSKTSMEDTVVKIKLEGAHNKKMVTRDASHPKPLLDKARSMELKSRKDTKNSSVESLPVHIAMSPPVVAIQAKKLLNSNNDKGLDLMKGKCVLMVDDSATYLKGGQALLTKMGCNVFVATDGEEALEIMKHVSPRSDLPHQFDIVFMDLSMPKMDGIHVVKFFRIWERNQPPGRARTMIIAVTANDSDGGMVLCAQTGFDGFVTKPLTRKKIHDCLVTSGYLEG